MALYSKYNKALTSENLSRYVSFGDSQGNPAKGHSDWTIVIRSSTAIASNQLLTYSFTIRNSQLQRGEPALTSEIIADAPAGKPLSGLPVVKSLPYLESAAYTAPPDMKVKVMRQSNPKPGELNNITMLLRPSVRILPNSAQSVKSLLSNRCVSYTF